MPRAAGPYRAGVKFRSERGLRFATAGIKSGLPIGITVASLFAVLHFLQGFVLAGAIFVSWAMVVLTNPASLGTTWAEHKLRNFGAWGWSAEQHRVWDGVGVTLSGLVLIVVGVAKGFF